MNQLTDNVGSKRKALSAMKSPHPVRLTSQSIASLALAAALTVSGISPALANDTPTTDTTVSGETVEQVETPTDTATIPGSSEIVTTDAEASNEATPDTEQTAPEPTPVPTAEAPAEPASPAPLSGTVPGPAPLLGDAPAGAAVAAAAPVATGGTKRFHDVRKGDKFYQSIMWMYSTGLTTGVKEGNRINYKSRSTLSREAMAAFLYREAGSPAFTMPKRGFIDVPKDHKFYTPIMWMKANKLTTGVKTKHGLAYKPGSPLSREAMAAFLYRGAGSPKVSGVSFPDVPRKHKFYRAITWMEQSKLTTGVKQPDGSVKYLPQHKLSREAMAAFMHRQAGKPAFVDSGTLVLTGVSAVDSTLTVKPRGWQPSKLDFKYQWLANGTAIAGATSSSYTPVAGDLGAQLSVRVSAALPDQKSVSMNYGPMKVKAKAISHAEAVEVIRNTVFDEVNALRVSNGLNALEWAPQYADGSNTDAKRQLTSYLDYGFGAGHVPRITYWEGYGITDPSEAPYDIIAAAGADTPQELGKSLVDSWMGSPSHCWWILRESTTAMYPGISLMDASSFGPEEDGGFAASMLAFRHDIEWDMKPGYDSMDPSWPANQICK